jgi:transglycosylase-like protein with SLT domain
MKYLRLHPIGLSICIILTGLITSPGYTETASGHSFKRIKVTTQPIGSRINIQIKPEESYYHQKPSTSTSLPVRTSVSTEPAKQAQKPIGQFDWFWSDFNHDISSASLTRLNDAERQLSKTPQGSRSLAPNLATMRKLVSAYGTDILIATLDKDVSPALVLAVMGVESAGKVDAVSSAGAVGLMQLIPATAKRFNVTDISDAKQNIAGGVAYLDWLIKEFNNDPVLALAGYNAGENAVKKHNGVPPFAETRAYVPKVVAAWQVAKALCKTPPKYAIDGCVFDLNPKVAQQ